MVIFHFRDAIGLPTDSLGYQLIEKGYLAVDFFFVLSGFVIYLNYHHSLNNFSSGEIFQFILKRFARVYPLHLFLMIIFLINPIAILLASQSANLDSRYNVGYYISSIFMIQNWGFYDELAWNIPAWSISTEFAAYILFPLMSLSMRYFGKSFLLHCLSLLLLSILIIMLFWLSGYSSIGDGIARVGVLRCILEFFMGVVVANFYVFSRQSVEKYNGALLFAAVIMALFASILNLPDYILSPIIFAFLVLSFSCSIPFFGTLLGGRCIFYLGEISYSTYLVHYFIKDWVKFLSTEVGLLQFVVYIFLVFVASVILYKYVECPGRDILRRLFVKPTV